jgi:hypothetical protein
MVEAAGVTAEVVTAEVVTGGLATGGAAFTEAASEVTGSMAAASEVRVEFAPVGSTVAAAFMVAAVADSTAAAVMAADTGNPGSAQSPRVRRNGWQRALPAVFVFAEHPCFLLECAFSRGLP